MNYNIFLMRFLRYLGAFLSCLHGLGAENGSGHVPRTQFGRGSSEKLPEVLTRKRTSSADCLADLLGQLAAVALSLLIGLDLQKRCSSSHYGRFSRRLCEIPHGAHHLGRLRTSRRSG